MSSRDGRLDELETGGKKDGERSTRACKIEERLTLSERRNAKLGEVDNASCLPRWVKEKNQKKINSHRWFFNAFGPILQPNVCVLLDVGTMPGPTSIYHLWKAFDINSNVGGACGEIVALKGKYGQNLINPLGMSPIRWFGSSWFDR